MAENRLTAVWDWPVFPVHQVVTGHRNLWEEGVLTVNPQRLARLAAGEAAVRKVEVAVLRPADPVRLIHVADAVLPAVEAREPAGTFPGVLGEADAEPRYQHRLSGVAVLGLVDFTSTHDPASLGEYPDVDSILDMAGPGAALTPMAGNVNIALSFTLDSAVPLVEADLAFRKGCLAVARALAETTLGRDPPNAEPPPVEPATDLPKVAAVMHIGAEGVLLNTYRYGRSLESSDPLIVSAREVLGGAITNGAYDYAGLRNTTFGYQTAGVLRELLAADGKKLSFRGVVLARAYLTSTEEKRRSARMAAERVRELRAEGVVITPFQSGNSQSDLMFTIRECERRGIATTAIVAESDGGLTDETPEADCLVSCGNEDGWVDAWVPEAVFGGERLLDGRPARETGPIMLRHYLGACSQLGDTRVQAVSL